MFFYYKKLLTKWLENKLLKGTYLVSYLDTIMNAHLLIDSNFNKEFEEASH